MRILRIITRLNIGGPSQQAILLSRALHQPPALETILVAGQPDRSEGNVADVARSRGIQLIVMPPLQRALHPLRDLAAWWKLLRLTWRVQPDLIHTHMAKAGFLGRLTGWLYNAVGPGRRRGKRAAIVHTFHGHVLEGYFPGWLTGIFVIIERRLARLTDALIAVSPTIRDQLLALRIGRRDQWHVVPLGLELAGLGQLPLPNGALPILIGLVGRLVQIKNPGLFLEALARVIHAQHGAVSGVVVGDGPLRQELERQASALGVENAVQFAGWQRDLGAVYGGLAVACLTSWNEGTPVALIEAMAAGRAVVATDVGGVRDLLEDTESPPPPQIVADPPRSVAGIPRGGFRRATRGLLVQPGDAEGVAAALSALIHDEPLRRTLGEAGRAYALQRFEIQRLVRDIRDVYARVREETSECTS